MKNCPIGVLPEYQFTLGEYLGNTNTITHQLVSILLVVELVACNWILPQRISPATIGQQSNPCSHNQPLILRFRPRS